MSFDVWVSRFREGAPDEFSRTTVLKAFGSHITQLDATCWRVFYDEQNSCDVFAGGRSEGSDLITGFTVNRPCGDQRLWDALISILRIPRMVLYFPGGRPLIADASTAEHLPADMIDAIGEPKCILLGEDIVHEIQNA